MELFHGFIHHQQQRHQHPNPNDDDNYDQRQDIQLPTESMTLPA